MAYSIPAHGHDSGSKEFAARITTDFQTKPLLTYPNEQVAFSEIRCIITQHLKDLRLDLLPKKDSRPFSESETAQHEN